MPSVHSDRAYETESYSQHRDGSQAGSTASAKGVMLPPELDKQLGQGSVMPSNIKNEFINLVQGYTKDEAPNQVQGHVFGSLLKSTNGGSEHNSRSSTSISSHGTPSVDDLLAKVSAQQALIQKQQEVIHTAVDIKTGLVRQADLNNPRGKEFQHPAISPTDGGFSSFDPPGGMLLGRGIPGAMPSMPASSMMGPVDVLRLQEQLNEANNKLQEMEREVAQSRNLRHTLDQAMGNSPQIDDDKDSHQPNQSQFRTSISPPRTSPVWGSFDNRSEMSESMDAVVSSGPYPRHAVIWGASAKPGLGMGQMPSSLQLSMPPRTDNAFPPALNRTHSLDADMYSQNAVRPTWANRRTFSNTSQNSNATSDRGYLGRRPSFNMAPPGFGSRFDGTQAPGQISVSGAYTPSPIGTPLSPAAPEFSATNSLSSVWNSSPSMQAMQMQTQTYVSTSEPLNYRRLLERSVNCNWKYIVDKIVCNNDQQASIFLQQKLKIGTPEQRHAIVEAIVGQAYHLMINRFGNFLVQRCFEHGTPEQIEGIAAAIRGNTLSLSMDAFGCHVIQKAFDCVNEDFKAVMVSELLRRIPETVVHRYACHVWQKLFELRWTRDPPQIMKYVNEALHGRWHEVALGETGSLVVQNIFENCLEEDKRPCVNEVLLNIDLIAHGQFGNWCIQHICEHGAPADRSRALDTVIKNAPEYSMDQYASKVVEKCLKVGGPEFLERYLDRVCEGRPDRPRIPLIDIASDQYGNYLVQWILQHATPPHREQVASHIRKHMVSLRGSKFGSRVGMLCCNPSYGRTSTTGAAPAAGANPPRFANNHRWGFR